MKDKQQQLDYFEVDPEIEIKSWQSLTERERFEEYVMDLWHAPAFLDNREIIHKLGLDNDPRVIEADKKFFKLVLELGGFNLHEGHIGYEPEPTWWWYFLRDIHHGKYPIELLPDHLKEIYQEHLEKLKGSS